MQRDEEGETAAIVEAPRLPPLPVRIHVLTSRSTPGSYVLAGGSCVIGAGQDADVMIEDDTVSRRHAELTLVPEGVQVTDLQSRNGTFYLGQKVGQLTVRLGSRLRLGLVDVSIEPSLEALGALQRSQLDSYGPLLGSSPAMRQLFTVLHRLEGSLVTILLEGESGTGKELVARAIHERSLVAQGRFVAVNCGALDRALVRSDLFGHIKGAFTGASESRMGAFEAASGGTLLLDEIGELPLDVQPVLLRTLENGSISRVGEAKERPVTVRVVAATNRNLLELARAGRFREDLYYRLAVVKLELPTLGQRREDIEPLTRRLAHELGATDVPDEVLAEFKRRDWPGNVRELKNALKAYIALGSLSLKQSPADSSGKLQSALLESIDLTRPYAEQKDRLLDDFFRLYVQKILAHTGGNLSEAARISGLERSYFGKVARRFGKSDE